MVGINLEQSTRCNAAFVLGVPKICRGLVRLFLPRENMMICHQKAWSNHEAGCDWRWTVSGAWQSNYPSDWCSGFRGYFARGRNCEINCGANYPLLKSQFRPSDFSSRVRLNLFLRIGRANTALHDAAHACVSNGRPRNPPLDRCIL
ncbi:MAG: hypothetical protein IPG42_09275 [Betaproteobacteria bacterium]|nr:hypothetical protein [Betaproteobacteria bacterium]